MIRAALLAGAALHTIPGLDGQSAIPIPSPALQAIAPQVPLEQEYIGDADAHNDPPAGHDGVSADFYTSI